MKILAVAALALLLAGCGGGHQVLFIETNNEKAMQESGEFYVRPLKIDVPPNPEWEIEPLDWDNKNREWKADFIKELVDSKGRRFQPLHQPPKEGAIVELQILDMNIGHYSLFSYDEARVFGYLTVTDAKSGELIFKATARGETTGAGYEAYTTGGRVKFALLDVARAFIKHVGNQVP